LPLLFDNSKLDSAARAILTGYVQELRDWMAGVLLVGREPPGPAGRRGSSCRGQPCGGPGYVGPVSAGSAFQHSQVVIEHSSVHVVEGGDVHGSAFVFLHGWPQSWHTWQQMMQVAPPPARLVAIDLPGVGGSTGAATDGTKRQLAALVHDVIAPMGLHDVTLVGHDIGGMVAYAYLRAFDDIERAVISDIVVPGVDPWDEFLRRPNLWHFAMHSIPALPERLVHERQRDYFDYFYDLLSADPASIADEARAEYTDAYSADSALTAGFNWFRAFAQDAIDNAVTSEEPSPRAPLLYLRGERERGDIDIEAYVAGFRAAGISAIAAGVVQGAGHFTQEEAPEQTWQLIADFAGL
jgi:pimeloyl-ACP methyl ester carboxylesterase